MYEEHIHEASCYDEAGVLICEKEEHIHSEECFEQEPEETETADVVSEEPHESETSVEPGDGDSSAEPAEAQETEAPTVIETVTTELKHIIESC